MTRARGRPGKKSVVGVSKVRIHRIAITGAAIATLVAIGITTPAGRDW